MTFWARWLVVILAGIGAVFMTVDGTRALIVGDYITPQSGEFAGQLGPWAQVVSVVGIDPRSILMKFIFIVYGVARLIITGAYVRRISWSWAAMLVTAILGLWYLPFGTMGALVQIVLLLTLAK